MQDIEVSPISSSDFPFNKVKRSSANVGNDKHFYDFTKKNGSSVSEEFFYKIENCEDLWNGNVWLISISISFSLLYLIAFFLIHCSSYICCNFDWFLANKVTVCWSKVVWNVITPPSPSEKIKKKCSSDRWRKHKIEER